MIKFLTFTALFAATTLGETPGSTAIDYSKFPQRSGKIINGDATTIELVPWQVSIGMYDQSHFYKELYYHACGGSIISESWVVTAGHCLVEQDKSYKNINIVISGATHYKTDGSLHEIHTRIVHPEYAFWHDVHVSFNDIGLIRVVQKFEYGPTRQPVTLYDKDSILIQGKTATVSGWGYTEGVPSVNGWGHTESIHKKVSETLRMAHLSIVKKSKCNVYLSTELNRAMYGRGQICAYGNGIRSTCSGDSGGPLTIKRYLVGIASWIPSLETCASLGKPATFTEVAHYRNWIRKICHI